MRRARHGKALAGTVHHNNSFGVACFANKHGGLAGKADFAVSFVGN